MSNNALLASDNFASGSLAAGWGLAGQVGSGWSTQSVIAGSPFVAEPPNTSVGGNQVWTGLTWPNDQISEIIVAVVPGTSGNIGLLTRWNPGATVSGYAVFIEHAGYAFFRYDSGTGTNLKTASVTVNAGDKFTFMAAGSCLVLYRNDSFVDYIYDATYTSGRVGFGTYDPTSTANSHVGSWRGYSAMQQDGIWKKQGVVVPAIASDLAVTGARGTQNPSIMMDGNAQLLSGTVLKMWFAGGHDTCYAESPANDGLNWIRKSGAVVTGVAQAPCVVKVGSTYHFYGQATYGAAVQHWTSTDGVTFSLQSANVFNPGATLAYFSVVAIIGGTWYALYTLAPSTFPTSLNLATSPDGATWTAYSGNPVDTNFWGVSQPVQINGKWYGWGQTVNPHAQETTKPGIDPGEGLRKSSADFITWANPVHSAHHSQLFEGVSSVDGGCFVSFPINVNGKAYLYYSAGPDDAILTTNSTLQICAAIGPAPISSIITANEDGVQQTATDSFGSGLGNFTTPTGQNAVQIASGKAEGTVAGAINAAVYTGVNVPGASQYSEVTVSTHSLTSIIAPAVLMSTSAATWYEADITGPAGSLGASAVVIKRLIAGVSTTLFSAAAATPTLGDVWRLSAVVVPGLGTVLNVFQNNYLIAQAVDVSSALSSGNPGFVLNPTTAVTNAQISAWAGGNANVIPNYPSGSSWMQAFRDFANKRGIIGG